MNEKPREDEDMAKYGTTVDRKTGKEVDGDKVDSEDLVKDAEDRE